MDRLSSLSFVPVVPFKTAAQQPHAQDWPAMKGIQCLPRSCQDCTHQVVSAVSVTAEPAGSTTVQQPHALDRASSPLLRALPEYERQFAFQLARARALAEATQLR